MGDIGADVINLVLGAATVLFWRQLGFAASWCQERTWRYPKGTLTTGHTLRATQVVVLLVGTAMLATSILSLAL